MEAWDIIQAAVRRGEAALSEYESKKVLSEYGLPVTREELAMDAERAALLAGRIGFPVALKASGARLMHKTEGGLIELGIGTESGVREAFVRLSNRAGADMEGVLVQEMVAGPRELVLGLNRDAQFGPVVMVGLGGVMTEILNDTAFRMAPIDMMEAFDMMEELRGKKVFDAFRGQAPADRDAVGRALIGLGRIGLEHPEVIEIDVNPLIVRPDGRPVAADALIVLERSGPHA